MSKDIPDHCENFHALAVQPAAIDHKRLFVRLRCKMWTCAYCAAKNREIWRARLINHIHKTGGAWTWFTITAHRFARGEQRSLANLRQAWDALMKRMKRKFGNFSYARVYEKHQDGSYHIHAIASFNFGDIRVRVARKSKKRTSYSRWLQKTAWELGIGMYTHAEDAGQESFHSGFIASYITKYIVKLDETTKAEFGRVRHIQTSQNWTRVNMEGQGTWEFKFGLYYPDIADVVGQYEFVNAATGEKVSIDDFENNYIYPPDFN